MVGGKGGNAKVLGRAVMNSDRLAGARFYCKSCNASFDFHRVKKEAKCPVCKGELNLIEPQQKGEVIVK
jgi:predicted Zn-ribbon and HTH transcriptional regulator